MRSIPGLQLDIILSSVPGLSDLESIYMIDSNKGRPTNNAKSNVIKRSFYSMHDLRLYLTEEKWSIILKLLLSASLGRMNDLALLISKASVKSN